MPNNIQNKLVVTGKENDIKIFLDKIKNDDNQCIDFNKIIPMPSILKDTIEGSKTSNAIYYYLYTDNKKEYIEKMLSCSNVYSIDRFKNYTKEELKEYFEIGKKYFEIYKEYGSVTWYDWSIKNWGTKWNAYETYADDIVSLNYDDDTHEVTMYFQTAWSGVPMLIEKLIYMFPNLYFDYKYADEDMACNCGEGYGNEEQGFYFDVFENNSNEAFECYLECWEDEKENFVFENGYWRYKDNIEEE